MPALNYVSTPPQAHVINRARIHLLTWCIAFFFLAFALAVGTVLATIDMIRDIRSLDMLLPLAIFIAIIAGFIGIFTRLGRYCLRAHNALSKLQPGPLKPAITAFTILAALSLFATLLCIAPLPLTILFHWTRRS